LASRVNMLSAIFAGTLQPRSGLGKILPNYPLSRLNIRK
jgi:hypothetical protein